MRLRNKKTGEIGTYLYSNPQHMGLGYYSVMLDENPMSIIEYGHDFDRLYQEWDFLGEDYEEPKGYWCIDWDGGINHIDLLGNPEGEHEEKKKQIGNYFETEEEAEKAVEKLKAWKRLKDAGFKFGGNGVGIQTLRYSYKGEWCLIVKDFNLLFGGEE